MMWPVISKLELDMMEEAIITPIINPKWSTQSWFPRLMKKVIGVPILIKNSSLILPRTQKKHPMEKMILLDSDYY